MKIKTFLIVASLLQSTSALSEVGFVYEFTGGDATQADGSVISSIDGDSTSHRSTTFYTEADFEMVVSPEGAAIVVGNYYGSAGEGVVHGHWKEEGGAMEKLVFSAGSGEAFDLNYYVLTSNTERGGGTATGNEDTYIIASKDGVTESFRSKLPSEDWGIAKFREIYLGPEFDDIKAFWFDSEGGTYCFGMDKFYVNLAPPEPTTDDAIVVGSGSVDDAVNGSSDADGDGIPDSTEGTDDTDSDGTPDSEDVDSDNDGVPDVSEGTFDSDEDGIPDYIDTDSDNDGIPDTVETAGRPILSGEDTDGDGIDDALDVDSTGGSDEDADGMDDALNPTDSDGDGLPDYTDVDSDGDGIPDRLEADMVLLSGDDSDNDGVDDALDVDTTSGTDNNGDGIDDMYAPKDADGDGIPNHLDLDADDDGIPDVVESGASGTDSDSDGIDDSFDVDITGGVDSDNDGIDDTASTRDSDSDGVPDRLDLDSDNDGTPDVQEAGLPDDDDDGLADDGTRTHTPRDTDSDGVPDYRDTDSDNDGVSDLAAAGLGLLDEDDDGRTDDSVDTDNDGIPDVVDTVVGKFGGGLDTDRDGIPNSSDLDDDNDGLADTVENATLSEESGDDTDGDGKADTVDLDSDNDGIPDTIESGLTAVVDRDGDGRVDDFADTDNNGIHDAIDTSVPAVDSDEDGVPDFQDPDSDADSLSDLREIGLTPLDANDDGRIDSAIDTDRDGLADVVDVDVAGGTPGVRPTLRDLDGDGIFDHLDSDTDGDGFADALENGDFDGDGVPDSEQNSGKLETAVTGGAGSMSGAFTFLLLVALLWRHLKAPRVQAASVVAICAFVALPLSPTASAESSPCGEYRKGDFNDCWFVGLGVGVSHLDPEGQVNGWSTDDDSSQGMSVFLGQQFRPHWFWELNYVDAGEASLGHPNPALEELLSDAAVEYQIPSLMVGYHLWDKPRGFDLYGKAGVSRISTSANDHRIGQDQQTSVQLALGVGVKYGFHTTPWDISLELDSYDRDANFLSLRLTRRFTD